PAARRPRSSSASCARSWPPRTSSAPPWGNRQRWAGKVRPGLEPRPSVAPMPPVTDTYETIRYDVADAIATITLHRPERLNAFTEQMLEEMVQALDRADADDDVRVVIFTGEGRAFCAGA